MPHSTPIDKNSGVEPVAIIGMACRWPGGVESPSQFWDMLEKSKSGRGPIPASRFDVTGYHHPDRHRPGTLNFDAGHFLSADINEFDAAFFGIHPAEATRMDPQQRKLLEVAYECFEASGVTLEELSGSSTGCFIGNFGADYAALSDPEYAGPYHQTGFNTVMLSNRMSYVFDLKGPSMTIDTACSSSLYALHLACNSLRTGDCKAAIVGGVNLVQSVECLQYPTKLGVFSPTSTCHSFDAAADGYARADGIGAFYLKKLSEAIRHGDPIRAVIRGSAVNANGKSGSLTHPSTYGQEEVMIAAYRQAGLSPDDTAYCEAHGTGTPVGDPIEVAAIGKVFGPGREETSPLLIGSVKTNLGHSEGSSGISGVMKCVLALEHEVIPPTIGLKNPNPNIDFSGARVKVVTLLTKFPEEFPVRRASVNNFGYGGANAHIILEAAESAIREYKTTFYVNGVGTNGTNINGRGNLDLETGQIAQEKRKFLLTFSAATPNTLSSNIRNISSVADHHSMQSLAHTLNMRRSRFAFRTFTIADQKTMSSALVKLAESTNLHKINIRAQKLRVGFAFTGQGAQWAGMGRELLEYFPKCQDTVQKLDKALRETLQSPGWRIRDVINAPLEKSPINDPWISQPLCTALQIMLVDLLESWDIQPVVSIGHSSGEIAAAYSSGYLTATQAIRAAYCRGLAVKGARTDGQMLAVGLGPHEFKNLMAEENIPTDGVTIACINSGNSITLSGDMDPVQNVKAFLDSKGVFARPLKTGGKAYHSRHMKEIGAQYEKILSAVIDDHEVKGSAREKTIMISSVSGKTLPKNQILGAAYWRTNLESPVLFKQAVEMAVDVDHFIEIGPHCALKGPIRQIQKSMESDAMSTYGSTLIRGESQVDCLLSMAGELFTRNYPVDFDAVNEIKSNPGILTDLPHNAWQYSELPPDEMTRSKLHIQFRKHPRHDILGARVAATGNMDFSWTNRFRVKDLPWLGDHRVHNRNVVPGAAQVDMVFEATRQVLMENGSQVDHGYIIHNMVFKNPLVVEGDGPGTETILTLSQPALNAVDRATNAYDFKIASAQFGTDDWVENSSGRVFWDADVKPRISRFSEVQPAEDPVIQIDMKDTYESISHHGLYYGTTFRGLSNMTMNEITGQVDGETSLEPTKNLIKGESLYEFHPATIDNAIQAVAIGINYSDKLDKSRNFGSLYLPRAIDEVRLCISKDQSVGNAHDEPARIRAYGRKVGLKTGIGEFQLITPGRTLEFSGLHLTRINSQSVGVSEVVRHPYYRAIWVPDIDRLKPENANLALHLAENPMKNVFGGRISSPEAEMMRILDLLAHKHPDLRILQVGGGQVVNATMNLLGASSSFKRYRSYTFTAFPETESMHLESASWQNFHTIESAALDSPSMEDFDLIIIPDKPNAQTEKPRNSMLYKLLSENGRLIDWLGEASDKITPSHWPVLPFHRYRMSFNVPVGVPNGDNGHIKDSIVLVHRNELDTSLSLSLESELRSAGFKSTKVALTDCRMVEKNSSFILLADVESESYGLLETITDDEWTGLQNLVQKASSLLWVSSIGILDGENPARAMALGLVRSINAENATVHCMNIDIPSPQNDAERAAKFLVDMIQSERESKEQVKDAEFAYHRGLVHICRIIPDSQENENFNHQVVTPEPELIPRGDAKLELGIKALGDLDTLFWQQQDVQLQELKEGTVEVKVKATGMNMKDIHILMGRVDGDTTTIPEHTGLEGHFFSHEISGIVSRLGPKVKNLKVGDRVISCALGRYETYAHVAANVCCIAPEKYSFNELASLPFSYSTAIYALKHTAHLQRGESVLIHSGAEDFGIAAITLAKHIGATIYTTTSSQRKKDFIVKELGIPESQIFYSRDRSFVDDVLRVTDGAGVDVVICTMNGSQFEESFKCVAEEGRFVDLGRRDVIDHGKLDLHLFNSNATFTSFDFGRLRRSLKGKLLEEIRVLLAQGAIRPLVHTSFDVSELSNGFRHLMSDEHIGKVVINYEDTSSKLLIQPDVPKAHFKPEAAYMIIGGLGGLGCSLTGWMLGRGAKNFIFLSRSGTGKDARKVLRAIERAGGTAEIVKGDVSVLADVKRAVEGSKHPIRGMIHAAMVLRDGIFLNRTAEDFHAVQKCKVQGIFNLHHALACSPLDFFVMMSSVCGTFATLSQSNYCAANAVLDSIARHRHAAGLPVTAVGLGGISGIGYIHDHAEVHAALHRNGIETIPENEFLLAMETAMLNTGWSETRLPALAADPNATAHFITALEPIMIKELWSKNFDGGGWLKDDKRMSLLLATVNNNTVVPVKEDRKTIKTQLAQAREGGDEELAAAVGEIYVTKLSKLLMVPQEQIQLDSSVTDFGLDSMIGAELRNWLYREMGVDMTFFELASPTASVKDTVMKIVGQLKS